MHSCMQADFFITRGSVLAYVCVRVYFPGVVYTFVFPLIFSFFKDHFGLPEGVRELLSSLGVRQC